jgi:hypothetical protein
VGSPIGEIFVGAGLLAVGLIAVFCPDRVRKFAKAGQPFQSARKMYDLPGMNLYTVLLGLLFVAFGGLNICLGIYRAISN